MSVLGRDGEGATDPEPQTCDQARADMGTSCAEAACDEGFTVWTSNDLALCRGNPAVSNRFARTCGAEVFQGDDNAAMCCCTLP